MKGLKKAEDYFKERYVDDLEFKKAWDDIEIEYEFARQVIKRRNELNLTQKELADKLGTTQSVISRIENGHNCSLEWIKKLAGPLKCKMKVVLEPSSNGEE